MTTEHLCLAALFGLTLVQMAAINTVVHRFRDLVRLLDEQAIADLNHDVSVLRQIRRLKSRVTKNEQRLGYQTVYPDPADLCDEADNNPCERN